MTHIDAFLTQYGYFAIFGLLMFGIVGPLIPDETILVLSGIFVHRGKLLFLPATLSGIAGSMCGITLSYGIGLFGYAWLGRVAPKMYAASERHLAQAEQWFSRFGKWTLFFGYFVAGVRHFTALFAGISRMPFRAFAVYAYPGAVCWVFCFVGIGYSAGEEWSKNSEQADHVILAAGLLALALAVIWWKRRGSTSHL